MSCDRVTTRVVRLLSLSTSFFHGFFLVTKWKLSSESICFLIVIPFTILRYLSPYVSYNDDHNVAQIRFLPGGSTPISLDILNFWVLTQGPYFVRKPIPKRHGRREYRKQSCKNLEFEHNIESFIFHLSHSPLQENCPTVPFLRKLST